MDELPVVMLGIRSAWHEDADTTPAQLLYWTALRLPGEMVPAVEPLPEADSEFLRGLQRSLRAQTLPPVHHHAEVKANTPAALNTVPSVYVRHDGRKLPLQRPYDGPFAIISRGPKHFVIRRNGTPVSVSIDRLKPAFPPLPAVPEQLPQHPTRPDPAPDPAPDPDAEAALPTATTTRSGRLSRPPDRLNT